MEDQQEEVFVTDEEKLSIIQYFITKCPAGQSKLLMNDIQQLSVSSLLTKENVEHMFHAYNLDTYQVIQNPLGPHNLVVSPETDREDGVVYDPISNKYYRVDHYEQVATEEVSLQEPRPSESVLELCKKLQTALDDYVRLYYIGELVAAVVVPKSETEISIIISGEAKKLRSFWSGKWISHYTLAIHDTTMDVTGFVKIHTHFYENGNVQMKNDKNMTALSLDMTSEDFVRSLFDSIKEFESQLQSNLDGMFVCMKTDVVKSLRRLLPRTQTKFQWNVNAHLMVRDIRQ